MKNNNHQHLTGISDHDLFFMQVEYAMTYLQEVMGCDTWETEQICKSVVFWKWWLNHWHRRDAEFTISLSNSYHQNKEIYKAYHNPHELDIYPHRVIMQEAYDKMMHELVKKEVVNG